MVDRITGAWGRATTTFPDTKDDIVTTATRRALGLSVAVVGAVLAILGLWLCVTLGPSGGATFGSRETQTGALTIEPKVLNALDVPTEVTVSRKDGGPLWVGLAGASDAAAVLRDARRTTVKGVSWPSGSMTSARAGSTAMPDVTTADVWRVSQQERGSASVVVAQGQGPETLVVAAPGGAPLPDVDVTVAWHHKTWFFLSLLLLLVGALLAAGAGFFLWQDLTAAPAPQAGASSRSSRHQHRPNLLPRRPRRGRTTDGPDPADTTTDRPDPSAPEEVDA